MFFKKHNGGSEMYCNTKTGNDSDISQFLFLIQSIDIMNDKHEGVLGRYTNNNNNNKIIL